MARYWTLLCLCISLSPTIAAAQIGANRVQLPVVSQFEVITSVSVPDQGAVVIGGVNQAATSSTRFGPLPMGARSGSSTVGSTIQAAVRIHRPEEMDAALLNIGEVRAAGMDSAARANLAREILRKRTRSSETSWTFSGQNSMDGAQALQILRTKR